MADLFQQSGFAVATRARSVGDGQVDGRNWVDWYAESLPSAGEVEGSNSAAGGLLVRVGRLAQ